MEPRQLDIFNDSHDVMLRNDVLQALIQQQLELSQSALCTLRHDYPEDASLAALQTLIDALAAFNANTETPAPRFTEHVQLQQLQQTLQTQVLPAAQQQMGQAAAQRWLRPFWQALITRATDLPFVPQWDQQHAAPLLLQLQDWSGAADAVSRIASWRRIPAPLAWMAQAKLNAVGLNGSWPLLTELAWLSPKRLDAIIQAAQNAPLQRLKDQFDAEFEPSAEAVDASQDLAWFPAWVLTQRPQDVALLSLAQLGQHSAPEQAFRLLVNLLGLERQGRHHDIVAARRQLRDLNGWLYGVYMRTR